jgi:hypothetical protein
MTTATQNTDLAGILDALLTGERTDAFGFLASSSPYVGHSAAAWRTVQTILAASRQRQLELAAMLDAMGVMPRPGTFPPETQYLAFLSMEFLLPKLIEAKERSIRQYEMALTQTGDENQHVTSVLARHLEEHRAELDLLKAGLAQARTPA